MGPNINGSYGPITDTTQHLVDYGVVVFQAEILKVVVVSRSGGKARLSQVQYPMCTTVVIDPPSQMDVLTPGSTYGF